MNTLIPFIRRSSLNNWIYDMDRFFEAVPEEKSAFNLQVDVEENADHIALSLDLPGFKEEDFSVQIEENRLVISGERKKEIKSAPKDETYSYYGRQYGKFYKAFTLPPDVDTAKVEAQYECGVLKVLLPKSEEQKPKTIPVKVKGHPSSTDAKLSGSNIK